MYMASLVHVAGATDRHEKERRHAYAEMFHEAQLIPRVIYLHQPRNQLRD